MNSLKSIAVVGWHEGIAGVVDSWLPEIGYRVTCFISIDSSHESVDVFYHSKFENELMSYPQMAQFKNRPLHKDPEWYLHPEKFKVDAFLVTLGNSVDRMININAALGRGIPLVTAVHPSSTFLSEASIGVNSIVLAGVIIGYKAKIGNGVIINTGSQLDHHVVVRDGVTIDPGCVIAGNVLVDEHATLHTSTTVINKIKIGKNSVTGAGSVILRDVPENATVVGNPARTINKERD